MRVGSCRYPAVGYLRLPTLRSDRLNTVGCDRLPRLVSDRIWNSIRFGCDFVARIPTQSLLDTVGSYEFRWDLMGSDRNPIGSCKIRWDPIVGLVHLGLFYISIK